MNGNYDKREKLKKGVYIINIFMNGNFFWDKIL